MIPLYKCTECGHEFELPDTWQEYRGEFWGMPAYETISGCPMCHSTDFEAVKDDQDDEERDEDDC